MGANIGPSHRILFTPITTDFKPKRRSHSKPPYRPMAAPSECPSGRRSNQQASKTTRARPHSREHDMNPHSPPSQARKTRASFCPRLLVARWGPLGLVAAVTLAGALLACASLVAHVEALPELSGAGGASKTSVEPQGTRAALEAELDALLGQQQQQHGQQADLSPQDANSKLLSEAIISRLMLGNMSDLGASIGADLDGGPQTFGPTEAADSTGRDDSAPPLTGPDAMRLRKLLSILQNYEMTQAEGGLNGGLAFSQFPVLPASQAATIKRASMKMGNYLRQQQQQQHPGQRQLQSYGRVNSFDFGLGKRPDASVASGNILRFGDSASAGGHMAAVSGASGLGKRPSAHRYDFGLGKRVASPAYPRYDFGLGKRAPSRVRYDFGLGRR